MKTPQVSWDADVAKNIAAQRAHEVKLDMVSSLDLAKAQLAKATGYKAEALRESIADLEETIAEMS